MAQDLFSITTDQAKQDAHAPGSLNPGNQDNHGKVLCFSSSRTKAEGAVLRPELVALAQPLGTDVPCMVFAMWTPNGTSAPRSLG